jgi:hypothetical protein
LPSKIDLNERNTRNSASARLSDQLDFSKEDRIPDMVFSEIIWKAVKREDSEMPAPGRSAFIKKVEKEDDESTDEKLRK